MTEKAGYQSEFKAPEFLAFDRLIKDNQWLIKIRFFYTFFVAVFYIVLNLTRETNPVKLRDLTLIMGLVLLVCLLPGYH